MSYQGPSEFVSLAFGAVRRTFDFRGRSSRTEVIGFYLLMTFVGLTINIAVGLFAPENVAYGLRTGAKALVWLPMFGLLVRRTHDVGWSGWWTAPAMLVAVYNLALALLARSRGITERVEFEQAAWVVGYVAPVAVVGAFLIMTLPGVVGTNRFGEDPRGRQA